MTVLCYCENCEFNDDGFCCKFDGVITVDDDGCCASAIEKDDDDESE